MSRSHEFRSHGGNDLEFAGQAYLHSDFARIAQARSAAQIETAMQAFAQTTGFDRYGFVTIDDDYSTRDSCVTTFAMHNTPPEFEPWWEDHGVLHDRPCPAALQTIGRPVVYGQDTYVSSGMGEKWEHQAPYGFACGVAAVLHLPHNQHLVFGVDRYDPLPADTSELTTLIAHTQLFATFVHCAVQGVLGTRGPSERQLSKSFRLSPREHECLQWAAEGKTAWETGMILSIAEGSVVKILASAIRKLDCANKPQAVVKALRLGLIH
jgi:DNA-binding CsgD family transcriptional regulator